MNSIKFYQCGLSLVSVLMLMDHPSSARSLISSPYLPHHFIWPKGNNKSLIHYPLTEAAMRKYLITGNKLNFNHSHFLSAILHSTLNPTSKYVRHNFIPYFMTNINLALLEMAQALVLFNSWVLSAQTHTNTHTRAVERLIYLEPCGWLLVCCSPLRSSNSVQFQLNFMLLLSTLPAFLRR